MSKSDKRNSRAGWAWRGRGVGVEWEWRGRGVGSAVVRTLPRNERDDVRPVTYDREGPPEAHLFPAI